MKILLGIIANDAGRFSLFTSCVIKLDTEGIPVDEEMLIGGDWCGARNTLVEMTLRGDYTHLWFMDDDHAFPPHLLKMLLRHDKPLVSPLCLARIAPFPLVTYAGMLEDGSRYLPIDLSQHNQTGLVELAAAGCAGMLIRRDVLEAIEAPWFEYTDRSEDIVFCEKAKAAGFPLYADLEARLGHITTAVVWPAVNEGKWMTGITVGRDLQLFVAPANEWDEVADEATADEGGGGSVVPAPAPQITEGVPLRVPEPEPAERIEMWYVLEDERWYGRALGHDGHVLALLNSSGFTQEADLLASIAWEYPGVDVYQLQSELDDSRNIRPYGPPQRLWSRQPGGNA